MKEEDTTYLRVVRIPINSRGAGGHFYWQRFRVNQMDGNDLVSFRFYDSAIDDFPSLPESDRRGFDVYKTNGHYYTRHKLCAPDPLNSNFILYENKVYYNNTFHRHDGLRTRQLTTLQKEMEGREDGDLVVKIPVERTDDFQYIFYDTQCRMISLNMEKCDGQWFADNTPCYQDPDDEDMVLYFYRAKV